MLARANRKSRPVRFGVVGCQWLTSTPFALVTVLGPSPERPDPVRCPVDQLLGDVERQLAGDLTLEGGIEGTALTLILGGEPEERRAAGAVRCDGFRRGEIGG